MVQLLKAKVKLAFILPETRSSKKEALNNSIFPPYKDTPLVTKCDKNLVSQHTSIVV